MLKLTKLGIIASAAFLAVNPLSLSAACTPSVTALATEVPDSVNFPGNPFVRDFYGSGVEINGDYAFVIAPGAHPASDPTKTAAGALYAYHKEQGGWVQKQIITTLGTSDHVGGATVRSQGNWLFVSAFGTPIGDSGTPFNQDFKGSVRIYKLNTNTGLWNLNQVLDSTTVPELSDLSARVFTDPNDPSKSDPSGALFGASISVNAQEGWMIVGGQGQNGVDVNNQVVKEAGAAYFFKLDNGLWKYKQKVTNPNGATLRDNFGAVVETNGNWAFVSNGDLQNHPGGRLTNSNVFVYNRNGNQWTYVQQLSGSQTQAQSNAFGFFDAFGNSISVHKKWLVVGAPLDSTGGRAMGAAYIFKRNNGVWNATQTIYSDEAFDPTKPGHMLGFLNGVRIRKDTLVVGDPGHSGPTGNIRQGAILAYQLNGNTWNPVLTIFDPQGAAFDFFGVGATLNKGHVLGGTLTAIDFGYPVFVPPLRNPPTANGKAVLFQRNCF